MPGSGELAPRIDDYGLIADGHTAALVHRGGSIDWCCLKRLDASSVFGRLLDARRGGSFALAPCGPRAQAERRYLEGTLVLCTTWRTATGRARVLDFLAVCRESPGRARRQLVRIVEGLDGEVELEAHVARRFGYDGQPGREGCFLPCSFWLVQCLAGQGRLDEARERFERALEARNDLGLFSEEYDALAGEPMGNVPQALTHFSHVEAALALERSG
jgi:GH15 family glucan-1,4-alpha-glucosidase